METGSIDQWPTVPGWVWLEERGGPVGEVVPFVRLSYVRGIEAVEFALPRSDTLLLLWWESVNDAAQSPDNAPWVPVWVWFEQGDDELLTCVSLDRVDDVTPRDLPMPTSARARAAVRKAVAQALRQLSEEETAAAGVAAIEAAQHRGEVAQERPEPEYAVPQDEDWPTVPVWPWVETDEAGDWRAGARLSPTEDILPVPVQVPASSSGLVHVWFALQRATEELRTHRSHSRSLPVWLWVEVREDEPYVWVSFEGVAGVKPTLVPIPGDADSLAVLRDRVGEAMVWLTGCETPNAAAAELSRPATIPPEPPKPVNRQPKAKPKGTATRRKGRPAQRGERKMVIPRIRIVSGGLPGLGRRR